MYVVFSKQLEFSIQNRQFVGYNLITGERLEEEFLLNILEEFIKVNYDIYNYKTDSYVVTLNYAHLQLNNIETNEAKSITIDDINSKSEEYGKITEIFNRECWIKSFFIKGDELFIIVINNANFFGIYTGGTPPLIFKYDMEKDDFIYEGFHYLVYDNILKIYKKN